MIDKETVSTQSVASGARNTLLGLQYLRAVAALLVVYFHTSIQIYYIFTQNGSYYFPFGKAGVDLFFVISGFVMWMSTAGVNMTPMKFYEKRLVRIAPLYWGITLFAVAIILIAPNLVRSMELDPAHLLASLTFFPWPNPGDVAPGDEITPLVMPGWTLNYEMFFYAIFGIVLLLPKARRLPVLLVFFAAIVLLAAFAPAENFVLQFYGSPIILEFLAGIAIAQYFTRRRVMPFGVACMLLVLAFIALCYFDAVLKGDIRTLCLGACAILIVCAVQFLEQAGRVKRLAWLALIGDASYSIYLTHIFVIAGIRVVARQLTSNFYNLQNQTLLVICCLLFSTLVGILSYKLFEQPTLKFMKKFTFSPAR